MTIFLHKQNEEPTPEEVEAMQLEESKREVREAFASILAFFIKPLLIMWLWNMLLPGMFGIAMIGYLKALGLYTLFILFAK